MKIFLTDIILCSSKFSSHKIYIKGKHCGLAHYNITALYAYYTYTMHCMYIKNYSINHSSYSINFKLI